jgi:hypothetical protein
MALQIDRQEGSVAFTVKRKRPLETGIKWTMAVKLH